MKADNIVAIPALRDNYIWTILSYDSDKCVIVDPGEATPVIQFLQHHNLSLCAIMITHHHWDHTGGIVSLLEHYPGISVFGPELEPVEGMTHLLKDGDEVKIEELGLLFNVLHVPGHTLGHIAFYGHGLVFSGDTLFTAGCGKIFEGTTEQMLCSLNTLAKLPDETLVYCGHEYTEKNLQFAAAVEPDNEDIKIRMKITKNLLVKNNPTVPETLAVEKLTNPFLRTDQKSVINAAEHFTSQHLMSQADVLHAIREWKNQDY